MSEIRRRLFFDAIISDAIGIDNYLTMVALEDGLQAKLDGNDCEYCIDGNGIWKTLSNGELTEPVNTRHTISFRANLTPTSTIGVGTFAVNKYYNLKGNCMSLLYGDDANEKTTLPSYAFMSLFKGNDKLVNSKDLFLPAMTVASHCYAEMYSDCISLRSSPKLIASVLTGYACYKKMFNNCMLLISASKLPATILSDNCYESMFSGCSALTIPPELPAKTLASYCYASMFSGCCALTIPPELPAITLSDNCYESMFSGCSALTIPPELPAKTLASYCYASMFSGCVLLMTTPQLLADNLSVSCYRLMFAGCISLVEASALPAIILARSCYNSMFTGCTSLVEAPELHAKILITYCYYKMFSGCKKLNYIKMMATDTSAEYCLTNWGNNVSELGTFIKASEVEIPIGHSGIPSGWTVIEE